MMGDPGPAGPRPGPSVPRPHPRPRPTGDPPKPPKKTTAEALLPVTEVAALLRCSRDHVYDLVARGFLRHIPIGGTGRRAMTRIPESAVAEFIHRGGTSTKRRSP